MKKSEWNDEQLEQYLKQMPIMKDNRSPKEIYQHISSKVKKKESRLKNKWVIPSFATVAAAFILLIIMPTFLNDFSLTGQDSASMESTNNNNATIMMDTGSEESLEAPTDKMKIMESEENKGTNDSINAIEQVPESTNVVWEEDLGEKLWLTYNVPHQSGAFFLPLTILVEPNGQNPIQQMTDNMSIINGEISQSDWGLGPFPSQYYDFQEVEKENGIKVVRADVKEDMITESFSSLESYSFVEGLKSFRWLDEHNYKEVELFQHNQQNVMIGQTGIEQPIIQLDQEVAYFSYLSPINSNGNHSAVKKFLVPTPYQYVSYPEDFESALDSMKTEVNIGEIISLQPTIKEDVIIDEVIDKGENVAIVFSSDSNLVNNEEGILMVEAIMLTAKEFGFKTVTFQGNIERIGKVQFGESVAVPKAPNLITYK